MSRKRGDLVLAGFFGAFGLVLTYLVTYFLSVPGDFWIALGTGTGITVTVFLCLFIRGIREARELDRWEEKHPEPYLNRLSVRMLSASEVSEGNLYLYRDKLIMVSPRKHREILLTKEEIGEIMIGAEDTELITDHRGIYSIDCGEDSTEVKIIREWHENQKQGSKEE